MPIAALDGRAVARSVAAGTYFLRRYRHVLNALNVFPVPDGDTGTNLLLTARAALAATRGLRDRPASAVVNAAARGALLGARGNSGVIFSQMLRGFDDGVRGCEVLDAEDLAAGLAGAAAAARRAVAVPVEGTMLSVASAIAAAAAASGDGDLVAFAARLVEAGNRSLDRSPEELDRLREAGVVDAGGAGLCLFLEAPLRFADGSRTTAYPRHAPRASIFTLGQAVGANRFCTEFVLAGATIAPPELRTVLATYGDSVLVAGEPPLLKLHVHAADPAAVRAAIAPFGRIEHEKVDDMERQHRRLAGGGAAPPFAVVAVLPGGGFARIARELGAAAAIDAGETLPSVADLGAALDAVSAERIALVVAGPELAAVARALAARTAHVEVIAAPDPAASVAVLVALAGRDEAPPDALAAEALAAARTAAVPPSSDLAEALAATAARLGAQEGGLLTLYYGRRQTDEDARGAAAMLRDRYPLAEVEYYAGGQTGIEYWVSFEH